jgi:hypothetical protein
MPKRRLVRTAEAELLTPAQFLALGPQTDGTVVRVRADATAGVNWRLRFNANVADAYKWEFDGGDSLVSASGSQVTQLFANATFGSISPSLQIVAPLAGLYVAELTETLVPAAAATVYAGVVNNGAMPTTGSLYTAGGYAAVAGANQSLHVELPITLAAGNTVGDSQWQNTGSTSNLTRFGAMLTLRPRRVQGP